MYKFKLLTLVNNLNFALYPTNLQRRDPKHFQTVTDTSPPTFVYCDGKEIVKVVILLEREKMSASPVESRKRYVRRLHNFQGSLLIVLGLIKGLVRMNTYTFSLLKTFYQNLK